MASIQQARRKLLQTGLIGFCIPLFAAIPKLSFARFTPRKGIVVRESEGVHILTGRRKSPNHYKNF